MNKNEFFAIGKVAKMVEVATHTIRFWQKQFPQILHKTGNGNRKYYNMVAVNQFKQIKALMYEKGMKIAGIQKMMLSEAADEDVQYTFMEIAPQQTENPINDLLSWAENQVKITEKMQNDQQIHDILDDIKKIKSFLNKIK